jgi:hypothetical protein
MSRRHITQTVDDPPDWPPPVDREARRWRTNRFQRLIKAADRMPLHLRSWFRVSEIADACARIPGSVDLDPAKRALTLELLRQAIYRGDFDDARKRSKVANLCPSIAAELRFARDSAAFADYFSDELTKHLWIRRADCKAWFERNQIELPTYLFPVVDTAADPQMPARDVKSSSTKGANKAQIKDIVSRYRGSLSPDTHPSMKAVESFAKESGLHGHRDELRAEYKSQFPNQRRGRPPKPH